MSEVIFHAPKIYLEGEFIDNCYLIIENGIIKKITQDQPKGDIKKLDGLVLPGLVNCHSHAFQILLRGRNDHPKDFKDWVDTALYPLVLELNTKEIGIASKTAYAQMIRNGITSVCEFHYIHNPLQNEEIHDKDQISLAVIDAALTTGIRQRFLYCGYDLGDKKGQKRFHRNPDEVIESVNRLTSEFEDNNQVQIGVAPHSLHGASKLMIRKLSEWAKDNKQAIHIHLAEQASDIELAKTKFNLSPLRVLQNLGVLHDMMTIVHGIWLDNQEIETMSKFGVMHAYNPLTNMALGDGIAPILDYVSNGITTGVGTDANISLNLLNELRTVEWLQRVNTHEMGKIEGLSELTHKKAGEVIFNMGNKNGGKVLQLPVGILKENYFADFIVLDLNDYSFRPNGSLIDQIVTSIEIKNTLKQVYVGGELIFDNGIFTKFNQKEQLIDFQEI